MTALPDAGGAVPPWWRSAVVYQIYPRSFADSDGDGIGDLEGIRNRLDHLNWLGVDAVWISPFYRSPMKDFGYDVSDHCDVDPVFGTLDDVDRLITEAHERGIRVLVDWVPNHTSDQHPWFQESRRSRGSAKRDWYIWRDEPNSWRAAFGGSAWTLDPATEQHYLHLFLPEQPDLNWRNPDLTEAMHDTLRFWLDRGVDGFRIDVAHGIGKDPDFADDPRSLAGQALSDFNDQPFSHEVLRGVRKVVDDYPGDRTLVGEVNLRSTPAVTTYYGEDDELHMAFNFLLLDAPWEAEAIAPVVAEIETHVRPDVGWPTWVLSNHDNRRHRTRYGGSEAKARAAAVLLLTLRGTPFLYQGEELGLEDAVIEAHQRVDPGGRDGCRAPVPWAEAAPHGWEGAEPWLPFPADAGARSVEALQADPGSILHLYRRLLQVRRESPALQLGDWRRLEAESDVLAFERFRGDDRRLVAVNFAAEERPFPFGDGWIVAVGSDGSAAEAFSGVLMPLQAVVLELRSGAG